MVPARAPVPEQAAQGGPPRRRAAGAGGVAAQPQRDRHALERLVERHPGLRLDVLASARLRRARAPAAEHAAERLAERAAAGAEEVVDPPTGAAAGAPRTEAAGREVGSLLVVLRALLSVGQDRVRLGDRLEALLCDRVSWV